jgi:hypothetical protein
MKLKFISQIRKGNNQGTGFIALPQGKICLFNLGDWVRVKVLKNKFFWKDNILSWQIRSICAKTHRNGK